MLLFLGAVVGQTVAHKLHILEARSDMDGYMAALHKQAGQLVKTVRQTLDAANRSPFEICSPDDLDYQRDLVFAASHVKDIGRLRGDRLICSTLLSDLGAQSPRSAADVNLRDGTYIYADRPLITPGSHGLVVGKGSANVVLSAAAFEFLHASRYAFAIFIRDPAKSSYTRLYSYPANDDSQSSFGGTAPDFMADGDRLKQNTCDADTGLCVSLSTRMDNTSPAARVRAFLAICLGMLAGGSTGLGWLYYRNRDRSLMSMLGKALAAKELYLLYQPVVNMADGKLLSFEALIRWEIRKDELVPSEVFIERAEQAGMADRITAYVLDSVIEEMGDLLRRKRDLRININITASDLQSPAFINRMKQSLAAAHIDPRQIGLELTERTAVDFSRASGDIKHLRDQGHHIYIDDFGTGYSSLAYLGELHVDAIKIDKAFTRTVSSECQTVSIVPQIVSMAREHGLNIVVEGVETEEQVSYFRQLSTPLAAQGWYFGKPMAAARVRALLRAPENCAVSL